MINYFNRPFKEKILFIFVLLFNLLIGGSIYYLLEILYRGYSHDSMFIVGGLCFVGIGLVNERFGYKSSTKFVMLRLKTSVRFGKLA